MTSHPFELEIHAAATPKELIEGSRVRFGSYVRTPGVARYTSLDHATGLDLDAYDFWSHHLVLVARTPEGEQVAGTLRLVLDEPSPQRVLLLQAFSAHPHLLARLQAMRPAPLPMLSYLAQADVVREHYERECARGLRMAEPTRLTATGLARRLAARSGFSVASLWVEAVFAYGLTIARLDRAYLDCVPEISHFYSACGFGLVPSSRTTHQPELGVDMLAMTATPDSLPDGPRERVLEMARQFATTGRVRVAVPADAIRAVRERASVAA